MNVWTTSSKCGRIDSNFPRSPNSYWSSVGHQHMARFLLSMQLILLLSVTLEKWKLLILRRIDDAEQPDLCELNPYLTKCWKMNLRTAWLAFGNLSSNFFISNNLICRSCIIEICSRSDMCSWGRSGGSLLKKKSFTAVATAFTAISRLCKSKFWSSSNFWKSRSTWARFPGTRYNPSVTSPSCSMNSIQRDRKTGIGLSSLALEQTGWIDCLNMENISFHFIWNEM